MIETSEPVLVDVTGGVATVTMNRPEAMNSLDTATKSALLDAVRNVAKDDTVRCVVLTGTGRAFCVGQDLNEHVALLHGDPIVTLLATMPKPVLAAVNGVAAGAGASLALACDLRVVSDTAGFNLAFAKIALSCDTGSSVTLQRLVGRAKALELLYLPRTVGAEESLALGLATSVVSPSELASTVGELAARLATGPTVAYASIRQSVSYAAEHPLAEALEFEGRMMRRTGATSDHAAAVAAFLSKEQPVFEGR
jgi:2-(1,2-epoxy-1,2-dihydrophenyl)acetyl-CoA isomerase